MFFTQEDYRKIEKWLLANSRKDTDFVGAATPLKGNETVVLVQNGKNVNVLLKDLIEQIFLLGVSDFLNVTDKYGESRISLTQAIQLIPYKSRKIGQVITFLDEDGEWKLFQFQGERVNQWNNATLWVDLIKRIQDISIIDSEDITATVDNLNQTSLTFSDKNYNTADYSGLGRVYLRKNIQTVVNPNTGITYSTNLLTQAMLSKENTVYIIQYDYNLNGQTITIPSSCVLLFEGGSISNGILSGTETTIDNSMSNVIFTDIDLNITINKGIIYSNWILSKNVSTHEIKGTSDIINRYINNQFVTTFVLSTDIYIDKAIHISNERDRFTLNGNNYHLYKNNDNYEEFTIYGTKETINTALLVCKAEGGIMHSVTIENILIGCHGNGISLFCASCTFRNINITSLKSSIKGYCSYLSTFNNVNVGGGEKSFDFSETKLVCTSLTFNSCYAINSDVGWDFLNVMYSSLNSVACDSCGDSYKFRRAEITINGLGAEVGKGTFLDVSDSNIIINSPFDIDRDTLGKAWIKLSSTEPAFVCNVIINGMYIYDSASYYLLRPIVTKVWKGDSFQAFDISANSVLTLNNSMQYCLENIPSKIVGKIINDNSTPLYYPLTNVSDISSISPGDNLGYKGITKIWTSTGNTVQSKISSKDAYIYYKPLNQTYPNQLIVTSEDTCFFNNLENVTIENFHFLINSKTLCDILPLKNVTFKNCRFEFSNIVDTTVFYNSTITFQNCTLYFVLGGAVYSKPFIKAINSIINFEYSYIQGDSGGQAHDSVIELQNSVFNVADGTLRMNSLSGYPLVTSDKYSTIIDPKLLLANNTNIGNSNQRPKLLPLQFGRIYKNNSYDTLEVFDGNNWTNVDGTLVDKVIII